MNKEITRSSYTRRILEIVRSIDKQKQQITATLIDTRALQKDTNQLEEKLKRTFTVTDKLIFAVRTVWLAVSCNSTVVSPW